jgi:cyclopropane fatty-acyl-phospholipid synthase-like methyltransferase
LDYSSVGCEQTRKQLSSFASAIDIECADLFMPPERLVGVFDAVVSLGVIEHFEDGCATVRALARMLRPGGMLMTAVPNLRGIQGAFQWLFDPSNIKKHVLYSREQLEEVHAAAGLHVIDSRYIGPLDLHCVNPGAAGRMKSLAFAAVCRANRLLCKMGLVHQGRFTSPHLVCAAILSDSAPQ